MFLVTNPSWRAFERHEVMHVVAYHAWGAPPANTDWLQEGLAQAADGWCSGYTNEAVLRGLTRRHGWVPLDDVLFHFREQPDLRAYLQAAAFTQYLIATFGSDAIRKLWQQGATPNTMIDGKPLADVEAAWRDQMARGEQPTDDELAKIEADGCGLGAPPPDEH